MAFFLFVDESGQDRRASPYEVLAGVAIEDSRLWSLITAIHAAEDDFFGERISGVDMEFKAKKLLKSKTFRLAAQQASIPAEERRALAQACLVEGRAASREGRQAVVTKARLTALAQAKLSFVERVLELCAQHQVRLFASIVDRDAPRPEGDFLRKDYAYLFERFFYFLDDRGAYQQGVVVFDKLERSRSHILVDQMARYFLDTAKGRMRASRIVPEPFFVHSNLTTLIQVADLVAYLVAWGVRVGGLSRPARGELEGLAEAVCELRYRAERERGGQPFAIWSFAIIDDLRPREERP
ncbi:MAG: DUF3800 domain-containing protein [Deltaproteobacteria bacterium]|nr:DUF3800 domain-containing protein [Deltaproteobacteria bacterium]